LYSFLGFFFFFQAEDGIRDKLVTGVQTCALPIYLVLVIEAIHLVDAALRDTVDLDREPALLVEVTGGVLGRPLEDVTAELHWHSTAPVRPPRGPCTAIRRRVVPSPGFHFTLSGPLPDRRSCPAVQGTPMEMCPRTDHASRERRTSPPPGRPLPYFACPAIWPMRKITNSAGFTGAMPISQTIWPASTTSGGLVSESHFT